jgi:hypothetical protein
VISLGDQGVADQLPDRFFVLHQQDRFRAAERGVRNRSWELLGGPLRLGQVNMETAALPFLALHDDVPAALFDDAVNGGETEAGALAFFFGCEEGFKNARLRFFIHAHTSVADCEHHVAARPNELLAAAMAFIHHRVLRLNGELPSCEHRVFRIHHQIHQNLFELTRIGPGMRSVWR